MASLSEHHILVLGWPHAPQEWLKDYPYAAASRIHREKISSFEKRLKNISFHTPTWLWSIPSLSPQFWYEDWKNSVDSYDTIILINEIRGRDIFEYILDKNPKCRMCVFYDSPITPGEKRDPSLYSDLPIHFFTCDRKIASQYNITFIPYFYIFSPYSFNTYEETAPYNEQTDVFFVGEEKGDRAAQIAKISSILDEAGLTHDLRLIPQKRHSSRAVKNSYLSYDKVIERIKGSRAILELISDGQTGLTQRPYESLFFKKKLITTSSEITTYDFYHPENVFLLHEQPINELPNFLKTPFVPIPKEITEQYDFPHWLERFI